MHFTKRLYGWTVEDSASFSITGYGVVWYYSAKMLGRIDSTKVCELSKENLEKYFVDTVKNARSNKDEKMAEVNYTCDDGSITIGTDGDMLVIYLLKITERIYLENGGYTESEYSDFYVVKV